MHSRREAIGHVLRYGLAAATAPFWSSLIAKRAFAQGATPTYQAVVVITLVGGNDGNNLLIPFDSVEYAEYASLRGSLALPASSIIPLPGSSGSSAYGLHPSLTNIAAMYASKKAAIVCNIGPLARPVTKQQLLNTISLYPQGLLNHTVGQRQWESATTVELPPTGWGGRIADLISATSGSLPPLLNTSVNSVFATGNYVQGVAVQSGGAYPVLPPGMNEAILQIAQHDSASSNKLVAATSAFRVSALNEQVILNQAMKYGVVKERFSNSPLGASLKAIAQLLLGRSVIQAERQLFYAQQLNFDTHADQLPQQSQLLSDLDTNVSSFFAFLDDAGLSDDVLVCTHSDFSRTFTSNINGGSDHAWGSNQLILGGGIQGGRIIGSFPTLELGGPDDTGEQGIWIPTLSVTQMAAGIGAWLGLNSMQLNQVFPDLANFPNGALRL